MPFTIDRAPDLFRLTLTGIVTREDLSEIGRQTAELEDSLTVMPNRLIDMTGIESIAVGFTEVHELAERRRARTYPNGFKSALLISSELQKGYARMFQTLNDHPSIRLEIFSDRAAALAWLKAPV
jgi:hypothetical protein